MQRYEKRCKQTKDITVNLWFTIKKTSHVNYADHRKTLYLPSSSYDPPLFLL